MGKWSHLTGQWTPDANICAIFFYLHYQHWGSCFVSTLLLNVDPTSGYSSRLSMSTQFSYRITSELLGHVRTSMMPGEAVNMRQMTAESKKMIWKKAI